MAILTNLTRQNLARAVDNCHRAWGVAHARAAGGRVEKSAGLTWWKNEEDIGILFPRLRASDADTIFSAQLSRMRRLRPRRHISCSLGDGCTPTDLRTRLLARGFTHPTSSLAGMACDLSVVRRRSVRGLKIEPFEDPSTLEGFDHPFHDSNWKEEVGYRMAIGRGRPQRLWHFLAWHEGVPVGSAVCFLASGVAGIYDVGVPWAHRRQGIGTAITAAACLHARNLGYRAAVLISSPLGESVYRRVGFEEVSRTEDCSLSPGAQRKRSLKPAQQAMFMAVCAGDVSRMEKLIRRDRKMIKLRNQSGVTLLQAAAYMQQTDAAGWLLDRGAVLDPVTAFDLGMNDRIAAMAVSPQLLSARMDGLTPLHIAVLRRDCGARHYLELVRLLLEAGADATVRDDTHESTPKGWAQAFGDAEAIELFEEFE